MVLLEYYMFLNRQYYSDQNVNKTNKNNLIKTNVLVTRKLAQNVFLQRTSNFIKIESILRKTKQHTKYSINI